MLNNYLVLKMIPVAENDNVVYWKQYRITVLDARLFRLEKSEKGIFRDAATQAVWFRNMPKQEFCIAKNEGNIVIDTGLCKLVVDENREQSYVDMGNKRIPLDNQGNLLGTYRTLDNCSGNKFLGLPWARVEAKEIQLSMGVCSKTGVAVLEDSDSLTLGEDGEVKNERAVGSDEYIFAFGQDYREAVQTLYKITGKPPLVPRFALGNWWSRYYEYTDEEYLRVLNRFEEKEIPLSVATVDMDWHYSVCVDEEKGITKQGKNTPDYIGDSNPTVGWTGYSWNTKLFPDPIAFLQNVKKRNLKITLNVHPSDGVRFWEDCYEDMAKAVGVDAAEQKQIPFAFTNSRFINAYFDVLHHPHEETGVDFWWLDWQQPNIPWQGEKERDYDPLWALNHYHYLDNARDCKTPLTLSRYAGVGSHRYPLGFSGDAYITWETLAYLPYFTATASNIGYTWWSHDIGGHLGGDKDDELYLRMIQCGVFSPINRLHCACDETMTKEPWAYLNGTGLIAKEFLRLRHRLLPYLYTASWRTNQEGVALIEPLYYEWKDEGTYNYLQGYRFGSELIVCPVITKSEQDGYARVRAWLPQGEWTDVFTGDHYDVKEGGKYCTLYRTRDSIPVLIKEGGILPLSLDKGNGCANPQNLEIWTYLGNGVYTLYEDGKERGEDNCFYTRLVSTLQYNGEECIQTLEISSIGDSKVIPNNRRVGVRFKDAPMGSVKLWRDDKEAPVEKWLTDCSAVRFDFEAGKTYRVELRFVRETALTKWKNRAKKILLQAEDENLRKSGIYQLIIKAKTQEECIAIIENQEYNLPEIIRLRLEETSLI